MTEYINQRKLLLKLMQNGCPASVIDIVLSFPAVDTMLAVHGKWVDGEENCPICGESKFKGLDADIWADWKPKFCPNCGAKMDKEDKDDV